MNHPWLPLLPGLVVLCLPVLYINLVLRRPVWDEALYHLPELARYGPGLPGIATLRDSGSAVGPLFYVLFANLAAPFNGSLLVLRMLVLACAVGCLLVFARIAQRPDGSPGGRSSPSGPAGLVLLLVTFPYFLTLSGLFMSELPALLAGLAALLCFLRWRERPRTGLLVGYLACAGVAILVRQYFLFLPLGLTVEEVLFNRETSRLRHRLQRGLLVATPVLLLLPFVALWGGLVPPALQARHTPGLSLTGAVSFLVWTGVYSLPWLWLRVRRTAPGARLLFALFAIPPAILVSGSGGQTGIGAGVVSALFGLLPAAAFPVLTAITATLGAATLIVLARGLSTAAPARRAATLALFLLALVFAVGGPLSYERYFLPALPLLLVAFAEDIRLLPALGWSLLVQLPLAVVQLVRLGAK